jgi:hypothetical protein
MKGKICRLIRWLYSLLVSNKCRHMERLANTPEFQEKGRSFFYAQGEL